MPKRRRATPRPTDGWTPFTGWNHDGDGLPLPPEQLLGRDSDNLATPRYIAFLADDYLDSDDDLAVLLAGLRDYHDTDIVVWDVATDCVAALLRRGRVLKFTNEPAPTARNGHASGKGKSRKHGPDVTFSSRQQGLSGGPGKNGHAARR